MENTSSDSEKSPSNETQYVQLYIDSMSRKELLAYTIAKSHLGTSFEIEKSVGYIQWKANHVVDNNRL